MSALELFSYNDAQVRTILVNDEPHFVAGDVCAILGYDHTPSAIRRLDDDEYTQATLPQVAPNVRPAGPPSRPVTVVTEPGLYSLILWSQKPGAKAFKRWVTHEVLPQLRRTGTYGVAPTPPPVDPVALVAELMAKAERTDAAEARLAEVARLLSTPLAAPAQVPLQPQAPTATSAALGPVQAWLNACAVPSPGQGTQARMLYRSFVSSKWGGGITETAFGRALTALGYASSDGAHHRYRPLQLITR